MIERFNEISTMLEINPYPYPKIKARNEPAKLYSKLIANQEVI